MTSTEPSREIAEAIERTPLGPWHVRLLTLCGFVVLLDGADNIAIGLVGRPMAATVAAPVAALGPIFSAGQIGFLLGALTLSPLADRFGRRPTLIVAVALFGVATIATTFATTVPGLVGLRLLTGVGLGGAAPVALALVAEYLPARVRATYVGLCWAAFPVGGVVVGLVSVPVLPHGWQLLFALIGAATLVLSAVLVLALPESLTLPGASARNPRRAAAVLRVLGLAERPVGEVEVGEPERTRVPVRQLFAGGRALRTVALWGAFFGSFLPLVFVVTWAPTILAEHGLTAAQAGLAITLNSVGSAVGSGVIGRVMDRWSAYPVILLALLATVGALVGLGAASAGGFAVVAVAVIVAGLFAGAAQSGIITLGSLIHPTVVRSTALGWAVAVGRLGAAAGPLFGAAMLAASWSPVAIYAGVAICPAVALLLLAFVRGRTASTGWALTVD